MKIALFFFVISHFVIGAELAYPQFQQSNQTYPLEGSVLTFPISGEIRNAFSYEPIMDATVRFIITSDSTDLKTDIVGHFNGRWTSVQGDVVENFPNPFNPSTTIRFGIGYDVLEIYTILGQLLSRVDINTQKEVELYMASGVYIYRVRDNETGRVAQNKMIALDGGYFTIYLQQLDHWQRKSTNSFNKSNNIFDDFAHVRVFKPGYTELDTTVRLSEGVRNNFILKLKPFITYKVQGSIIDNYGNSIDNARLLVINNPLNFPDTLFNQIVSSPYISSDMIRVAQRLDHVLIKVIKYNYEIYGEYTSLQPGLNTEDIELVRQLNQFSIAGEIRDIVNGEPLRKNIVIHRSGLEPDTINTMNGWFENTIEDTALSLILTLEAVDDREHFGEKKRLTLVATKTTESDFILQPKLVMFSLTGKITENKSGKAIINAQVLVIQQSDTLVNVLTNGEGIYDSGEFFSEKSPLRDVIFKVVTDGHKPKTEILTLGHGINSKNAIVK